MTDLDLMMQAAKAADVHVERGHGWQADMLFTPCLTPDGKATAREWNPLADDGDALRLAVKLNMQLVITGYEIEGVGITDCKPALGKWSGGELHHSDPYAATRRAIVRAAAAMVEA